MTPVLSPYFPEPAVRGRLGAQAGMRTEFKRNGAGGDKRCLRRPDPPVSVYWHLKTDE